MNKGTIHLGNSLGAIKLVGRRDSPKIGTKVAILESIGTSGTASPLITYYIKNAISKQAAKR